MSDPKVYWGNPNGKAIEGFYRFREFDKINPALFD